MRFTEDLEVRVNLDIILIDRGKRHLHHRSHNIVLDTGRQFLCENIMPQALGVGTFTRQQNTVVRYMGFGIGGTRQNATRAYATPYSDAYPAGYGGTNLQTDIDVSVGGLERPVMVDATLWMKEIATVNGGTFPSGTSVMFVSVFTQADINVGPYISVPISEIALYKSDADPLLPNGGGVYPGASTFAIAYDTFDPISKTGVFDIEARWTWQF